MCVLDKHNLWHCWASLTLRICLYIILVFLECSSPHFCSHWTSRSGSDFNAWTMSYSEVDNGGINRWKHSCFLRYHVAEPIAIHIAIEQVGLWVSSTHGLLSTIKDWDLLHQRHFCVVFARLLCSAGITNENEFHTSSSPTLCIQWRHFRPSPLTLFGNMASLVNLLSGDKWQNTAT